MEELELNKRLYIPNVEPYKAILTKKYFSARALEVRTIERGILLPARPKNGVPFSLRCNGGVFDADLNFIDGHTDMLPNKNLGLYVLSGAYEIDRANINYVEEDVIYGGAMIYHFGHFLTETMARMWYVIQHPELDCKIVFLEIKSKVCPTPKPWIYEFFELLGLSKERIVTVEEPTQFRSITVPDQALYFRHSYSSEFLLPYRFIVDRLPSRETPKKIFLSRSEEFVSKMCNVGYFDNFYRAHGYEVVYPEKLSLSEQVSIISGAEEIATFLGTTSHWAVVCKPGTKITLLMRVDEDKVATYTMIRQRLINEAVGIDWCLVSTDMNFLYAKHGSGLSLVGPSKYFKRFVADRYGETVEPQTNEKEVIDNYILRWCRAHSSEKSLPQRLSSISALLLKIKMLEAQIEKKRPILLYETHVARKGWLTTCLENEIGGLIDQKFDVQALRIYFSEPYYEIAYAVFYPDDGWMEEVSTRQMAGTTGKSKAIYGLSVRLITSSSSDQVEFDVLYRVHGFAGEWSAWHRNGAKLISAEMINGVQLKLVPSEENKRQG